MVVLCRAEHHDSHGLSSRHRLSMHPACEQAASTLPAQKLPSIWNFSYYMLHAHILSRGKSPGTACHDRFVCFRHATDGFRSESGPAQQIPPWFFPRRAGNTSFNPTTFPAAWGLPDFPAGLPPLFLHRSPPGIPPRMKRRTDSPAGSFCTGKTIFPFIMQAAFSEVFHAILPGARIRVPAFFPSHAPCATSVF